MSDNTYLDELRGRQEALHPCYNQTGSLRHTADYESRQAMYERGLHTIYPDAHWTNGETPSKQAVKDEPYNPYTASLIEHCSCRMCTYYRSKQAAAKQPASTLVKDEDKDRRAFLKEHTCHFCHTFMATGEIHGYQVCSEKACQDLAIKQAYNTWVDVPFWFAWLGWSTVAIPFVCFGECLATFWHPAVGVLLLDTLLAAIIVGWFVSAVTKLGHEYLGWFGGAAKGRVVKCNVGYTEDAERSYIPPIDVGDDEAWEGEKERYRQYWRVMDERNGLHRDRPTMKRCGLTDEAVRYAEAHGYNIIDGPISSSVGADPPTYIKRGRGLHHFTISVGFRHGEE